MHRVTFYTSDTLSKLMIRAQSLVFRSMCHVRVTKTKIIEVWAQCSLWSFVVCVRRNFDVCALVLIHHNVSVCSRGVQEPECRSRLRPESSRFSKMGVEPELIFLRKGRSRSQFFNKRLLCSLLIITELLQIVFHKACYNMTFKCAILLHRKS